MATSQRTLSLQVASQNAPSGYVKQWVSAYNLKWADLRKWLVETRFKNAPELDRVLVQDMVSGSTLRRPYRFDADFPRFRTAWRTVSTFMHRKY